MNTGYWSLAAGSWLLVTDHGLRELVGTVADPTTFRTRPRRQGVLFDFEDENENDDEDD